MVGDRLGMIAGRHRDNAALAFGFVQRRELYERATILERIRNLQIFVFDINFRPGQRRQFRRGQHGGAQHHICNDAVGCFDIGKRYFQCDAPAQGLPTMPQASASFQRLMSETTGFRDPLSGIEQT